MAATPLPACTDCGDPCPGRCIACAQPLCPECADEAGDWPGWCLACIDRAMADGRAA